MKAWLYIQCSLYTALGVKGGKASGWPGASASKCSHVAFVEAEASKNYETAKITLVHLEAFDCGISVGS